MDCIHITLSWLEFSQALCLEFGPSEFDNKAEALFKLKQTGTLSEYVTEFRHLANRTLEICMIFLKGCFIGGLKKELKYDVKLLKPATVHDAIAFAVQLDVKIYEFKSITSKPPLTVKPHITFATPVTRTVPHHGNLDIKKLFPDEIQKKRELGEC